MSYSVFVGTTLILIEKRLHGLMTVLNSLRIVVLNSLRLFVGNVARPPKSVLNSLLLRRPHCCDVSGLILRTSWAWWGRTTSL